jgi:hypothetical protein
MPIGPRGQIRYIGQSPREWSLCDECHSNRAMLTLFSVEPHIEASSCRMQVGPRGIASSPCKGSGIPSMTLALKVQVCR